MDKQIGAGRFDLVILDVMMPGEDGISAARRLSAAGGPPILMLSALSEDTDRIIGLEVGADDYLAKPFNPRGLLARVKAIMRRGERTAPLAGSIGGRKLAFAGWVAEHLACLRTSTPYQGRHDRCVSNQQLIQTPGQRRESVYQQRPTGSSVTGNHRYP
jgi:DNA-binding response OmpR family regulator